ncbi:hypothetical protein HELRODRAFT_98101 [Helobdella robusta]|uniref:Endophilin-A n=1 Tax=Helobdella robusta TaxID=6412 RepID=T1G9K6_HELRO|nr:hypothetical protein HELRODRAFT_98101 [Helobdella robusta]ESO08249.1 hypothetical protein HELRODRAFT_98101 [Helobdella robusta]
MSIAGLKKQVNKANQFMSEKIAGAKGTELDDVFVDMEKKTDVLEKLMHELASKVTELLQPNPASRAKMAASRGISKIKGQSSNMAYPQPEGLLADCLVKYGPELGTTSLYGGALMDMSECFREMADEKYKLEDSVKQNFLEPIHQLENKEIKEVNFHRKKLVGRRLDYDCKKRKHSKAGTSVSEDELNLAKEKFEESKALAENAMGNLLDNDAEQISQLLAFVKAELVYHRKCTSLLENLANSLQKKSDSAASHVVPKRDRQPSSPSSYSSSGSGGGGAGRSLKTIDPSHFITPRSPPIHTMHEAEALYDFEAENNNELEFKTGCIIHNVVRIDENWLEGTYAGRRGYFPSSYVKVVSGVLN